MKKIKTKMRVKKKTAFTDFETKKPSSSVKQKSGASTKDKKPLVKKPLVKKKKPQAEVPTEVKSPKQLSKLLAELEHADMQKAKAEDLRQELLPRIRAAVGAASFRHPVTGVWLTVQEKSGVGWFLRQRPTRHEDK